MNALTPYPVSDLERMAHAIAQSKLFGIQNVEQALALCLVAQAEGRHPASAAQDYHIVQGRPAKKADAMLRDFISGGGKVQWHELSDTKAEATFSHPAGGSAKIDWTLERAKRAQLATPMWTKYPRQMLRSRVVSEGVRTVFPMATSGMYVPEEVQDIVAEEVGRADLVQPAIQDHREAPAPPQDAANGIKRLTSARAKEIGLDKTLKDAIYGCTTVADLDAWDAKFDHHTRECPRSWVDAIKNEVIIHREGLVKDEAAEGDDAPATIAAYEAEFDRAFAGTVGPKVAEPA